MENDEKSIITESINNATINGNAIINNHQCSGQCKNELTNLDKSIQSLREIVAEFISTINKILLLFPIILNLALLIPDDFFTNLS